MKKKNESNFGIRVKKDGRKNKSLYLMIIPVFIFYFLFCFKCDTVYLNTADSEDNEKLHVRKASRVYML